MVFFSKLLYTEIYLDPRRISYIGPCITHRSQLRDQYYLQQYVRKLNAIRQITCVLRIIKYVCGYFDITCVPVKLVRPRLLIEEVDIEWRNKTSSGFVNFGKDNIGT